MSSTISLCMIVKNEADWISIAQICIEIKGQLLHDDKDFDKIQQVAI